LAGTWFALIVLLALAAPYLPLHDPLKQNYSSLNAGFSKLYWFGTDSYGRDLLSRILSGARVSLSIALTSPFIGLAIGLLLGMTAGFFRGWWDSLVGILVDSILAFPNIVLAMVVMFIAGAKLWVLILVLAFYSIPQFTRIARANTIRFAQQEFVTAARAQGASNLRILIRELLPNVIVPVAAYSLIVMSFTIILEGSLSFLGFGLPPPTPSWGNIIAQGVLELSTDPKIALLPSAFMFLTILSLNLMGDRLRSLSEVRSSAI